MEPMSVIAKYNARAAAVNSLVCVGLDTDPALIPSQFQGSPTPQYDFNRWIIDQTAVYATAFKINTAFYEARGSAGWAELEQTIAYLRETQPSLLTICDAKRGDIGSTSAAYARAIFDHMGFDSVTLNPYLGRDALEPFLNRADKGCILLCRTSNPGSGEFQDMPVGGLPLWLWIGEQVSRTWNGHNNCMLVVGATYPKEVERVRGVVGDMPLLIPGIGAQGGDLEATVHAGLTADGHGIIINASRSIIYADDPAAAARLLRDGIRAAAARG
jgi:orotidine-5'-phosphate decarboxylase